MRLVKVPGMGDCAMLCWAEYLFASQSTSMFVRALLGCWLTMNSNIVTAAMTANKIAFTTQAVDVESIVRPMIQGTIMSHKLQDGSDWLNYCSSFSSNRSFAADTLAMAGLAAMFEVDLNLFAICIVDGVPTLVRDEYVIQ